MLGLSDHLPHFTPARDSPAFIICQGGGPNSFRSQNMSKHWGSGMQNASQQPDKLAWCCRFAVIGSTGSHYNVELKDPAPTCQCVDYRIRKRICKHQKLVLLQLGIPDKPQDWHKVEVHYI